MLSIANENPYVAKQIKASNMKHVNTQSKIT